MTSSPSWGPPPWWRPCRASPPAAGPGDPGRRQATYAHKLAKEEAEVDWSQPAVAIDRLIRAFDPWPVAQTQLDGASLRIWGCDLPDLKPPPGAEPGQVIGAAKAGIAVATGAGVLRLTRLQPPGKRPMWPRNSSTPAVWMGSSLDNPQPRPWPGRQSPQEPKASVAPSEGARARGRRGARRPGRPGSRPLPDRGPGTA